ncbi:hypothetical protein CSUNSWCD_2264 [Campylobacter showae CSUNSWCD]|uniref:Uncharacterized protein n=1 Tax=Campylobacter showae CSUNSWCD TaxID=1244083 RepID=M5IQD6_9BACT|nr:hypothetical protein CSUNSWCD_2264 [Campylobacter showae CSUNSWCD]
MQILTSQVIFCDKFAPNSNLNSKQNLIAPKLPAYLPQK